MTIQVQSFLALEESLTSKLYTELVTLTKPVYAQIEGLIEEGKYDEATALVPSLSLEEVFRKSQKYIAYVTDLAMLFGASRVTPNPGTSVVGLGYEKLLAEQVVQNMQAMVVTKAEEFLKATALQLIAQIKNSEEPVQKAERRILREFQSFMDDAGKAYFNLTASLHTSRVSAYGFTAEAAALGVEEYQINEQLDNRICPVCALMHGKRFKVKEARALLDVALRVTDPDDLKHIQPWPAQTKDNLEMMAQMTPQELVARAWHIPPFHPKCRGLLTRITKAPTLQQIQTNTVPDQTSYISSQEDFKQLGLSASKKQVALWNTVMGMSPLEVFARLQGLTVDQLAAMVLGAESKKAAAGIKSFSIAKNITVGLQSKAFGSTESVTQRIKLLTDRDTLYLDSMELHPNDQGAGIVKQYMRELLMLARDTNKTKIGLVAGLEVGGYAWARYGFIPDVGSWDMVRKAILADAKKVTLLTEELKTVLESSDPQGIFTIADSSVGKQLLMGTVWNGELDITSPEAMKRFLKYMGGKA